MEITKEVCDGSNGNREDSASLHAAVKSNDLELVNTLLSNIETSDSQSALYFRDEYYHTPMYYAVAQESAEMVRLFINAGHDVNHEREKDKVRLLHVAVRNQNFEIVKILLNHGADVNATCLSDLSPLHYAVRYIVDQNSFLEILVLFIENGVNLDHAGLTNDINLVDEAALNIAISFHKISFAGLLVRFGCRPNALKVFHNIPEPEPGPDGKLLYKLQWINTSVSAFSQAFGMKEYHLCRLLHSAGFDPSLEYIAKHAVPQHRAAETSNDDDTLEDSSFYSLPRPLPLPRLLAALSRPRRLAEICRLAIRRALPDALPKTIAKLNLPGRFEDFLLFSDFAALWKDERS